MWFTCRVTHKIVGQKKCLEEEGQKKKSENGWRIVDIIMGIADNADVPVHVIVIAAETISQIIQRNSAELKVLGRIKIRDHFGLDYSVNGNHLSWCVKLGQVFHILSQIPVTMHHAILQIFWVFDVYERSLFKWLTEKA